MHKHIAPIIFLSLPAMLAAEEAAKEAADSGPGMATIVTSILGIITAVVIPMLTVWLKKKFKVDAEKAEIDKSKSLDEQKSFFIDNRVIPFVISTCEHWLLTQLPGLVKDATDGDGFDWKTRLDELKDYTKTQVLKKFAAENKDVIEYLGEGVLEDIINRQAVKLAAKLPDSVKKILPDDKIEGMTSSLVDSLVDKGLDLLSK